MFILLVYSLDLNCLLLWAFHIRSQFQYFKCCDWRDWNSLSDVNCQRVVQGSEPCCICTSLTAAYLIIYFWRRKWRNENRLSSHIRLQWSYLGAPPQTSPCPAAAHSAQRQCWRWSRTRAARWRWGSRRWPGGSRPAGSLGGSAWGGLTGRCGGEPPQPAGWCIPGCWGRQPAGGDQEKVQKMRWGRRQLVWSVTIF